MMLLNNKSKMKKRNENKQKKKGKVSIKTSNLTDTAPQQLEDSDSSLLSGVDPSECEVLEKQTFDYVSEDGDDRKNSLLCGNSSKRKNKKEAKGKKAAPNRSRDGKTLSKAGGNTISTTSLNASHEVNFETQKRNKKRGDTQNGETARAETIAKSQNKTLTSESTQDVSLETHKPKKKKKKKKVGALNTLEGSNNANKSDSKKTNIASEGSKSHTNSKLKKSVSESKTDRSKVVSVRAKDKKLGKKRKISDIFEEAEICMEEALPKKIDEVRKLLIKGTKSTNSDVTVARKERPNYEDLSFKKSRVDVDTSLLEATGEEGISSGLTGAHKILDKVEKAGRPQETKLPDIDPNKFIPVKTQKLRTAIPEFEEGGDSESEEEEEEQQHMNLMEAFADDDIADEFRKEKEEAEEETKPKTVDLRLPGWGSWGGLGIEPTMKRNRRGNKHLHRFPGAPRKDQGKKYVIVNDDPPAKFRKQQVDDLPSEFPSVAAYEAYVRAPIGNTWVPEAAHNALTAAPVVTKMGSIIQPLDESHLVKKNAEEAARKKMNDSIKTGKPARRPKHKAGKPSGNLRPEGGHEKNVNAKAKKRKNRRKKRTPENK